MLEQCVSLCGRLALSRQSQSTQCLYGSVLPLTHSLSLRGSSSFWHIPSARGSHVACSPWLSTCALVHISCVPESTAGMGPDSALCHPPTGSRYFLTRRLAPWTETWLSSRSTQRPWSPNIATRSLRPWRPAKTVRTCTTSRACTQPRSGNLSA
jgi:hypothetical protein